jgi:predicted nucleic acid-binding protein
MNVVADTGPLHYLVLIGQADVLALLYTRVLVPTTVVGEMRQAATPAVVRNWISRPPDWLKVRPDPPSDATLRFLDEGESAAIGLALSLGIERILIDDWDGRFEAVRRNLRVTGTLGVLVLAHQRGHLDFETALAHLSRTNFYLSAELVQLVRSRLSSRIKEP